MTIPSPENPERRDRIFPPTSEEINACRNKGPGLIDEPCETVNCKDTYPLGKKMRVFQGDGCERSGYWLQATFASNDMANEGAHTSGIDCDTFASPQVKTELVSIYGNNKIKGYREWCNCQKEIVDSAGVSGEPFTGKTFGHLLYYVGESVAGIKNKEWCNWDPPLAGDVYPIESSGFSEWFWEGARCNADGTRNETFNSGTLFGCCCTGHRANPFRNPPLEDTRGSKLYVLTEVSDIIINTSDDPCDCLRRKRAKSQFLEEWNAAVNLDDVNYKILISGCAPADAESAAALGLAEVGYAVCSGVAPSWNETKCAWDIQVKRVSRCPQGDTPPTLELNSWRSFAWCPSGDAITFSDRDLFYSPPNESDGSEPITYNHVNYLSCESGECSCISGAPLFDVGDYVVPYSPGGGSTNNVPGLPYAGGSWAEWELYDLSESGAANGSGFQWPYDPVSGCSASGNSWRVTRREYGDVDSWRETYDCTWGYQIEFTGCAPCSGSTPVTCSATGMAPNFSSPFDLFIPESYLSAGAICTDDASCTGTGVCSSGDSLFDVGDYVSIASYQLSGYFNVSTTPGTQEFSMGYPIDLSLSGAGALSNDPFSTGCYSVISECFWYFSADNEGEPFEVPNTGEWTLTESNGCCDCSGAAPDPDYIGWNTDASGIPCTVTSGSNILSNSWKVVHKKYGGADSSLDSLDCTWGYQIEFTGCDTTGVGGTVTQNLLTGVVPYSNTAYIPETYLTSGTGC